MIAQNPAERMVYKAMVYTWPFYAIGALYVVGPVLAWILGGLAGLAVYLGPAMREDLQATGKVPPLVWCWFTGMFVMLVVLWIGHLDWGLGLKKTIKSSIGWAKGWALLALFPLVGAVLPIRRVVLIRGQCVIGAWTLALAPLLLIAPYIGLPEKIFTSPLKAVGGPGPEYFSVYFFTFDPASWTPRWQFYAPWSPFAALLGVILFALEEKDRTWMLAGVSAGVLMILASKSRMGLVGLVACTIGPRMMPLILKGWAWHVTAALTASLGVFGTALLTLSQDAVATFKGARADSTRALLTSGGKTKQFGSAMEPYTQVLMQSNTCLLEAIILGTDFFLLKVLLGLPRFWCQWFGTHVLQCSTPPSIRGAGCRWAF